MAISPEFGKTPDYSGLTGFCQEQQLDPAVDNYG
jgi:hypothetical protein